MIRRERAALMHSIGRCNGIRVSFPIMMISTIRSSVCQSTVSRYMSIHRPWISPVPALARAAKTIGDYGASHRSTGDAWLYTGCFTTYVIGQTWPVKKFTESSFWQLVNPCFITLIFCTVRFTTVRSVGQHFMQLWATPVEAHLVRETYCSMDLGG